MTENRYRNAALIMAAGTGSRVGSDIPKQFLPVKGQPMLRHSYAAFCDHTGIDGHFVVVGSGQKETAAAALSGLPDANFVDGGATRRESVRAGLEAIAHSGGAQNILIHDAARPFLAAEVIDRLLRQLASHKGAVPALPVIDSLARGRTVMTKTVERAGLQRIQTPQAFNFDEILAAHRGWDPSQEATDDARMALAAGYDVAIVPGDERLAKYTFASDFDGHGAHAMIRTGNGFDVHRLVAGEELWLCGVKIDHSHGLSGHSDADVAIHALVDAILGALALGDIGDHFPPSDPQWRGASSDQFLAHAVKLAREAGYELSNADVTIICEAPQIGPHRQVMREKLAEIMDVQLSQISVKATTTERLGYTGRGEGITAQASASLIEIQE
ncbi:MAG: bifunctional 2-C-methyl-D-erythritol 4-phosphate cytidylyltransferase/2-C-methyl-D-erythritol 2,4-cyclodiphosphate synthase [Sphingorhabdus sp.]